MSLNRKEWNSIAVGASSERGLTGWTLLVCLGLWAALAADFFFGRIYTFDDLGAFHLPIRWFYAKCLKSGDAFDWIPSLFSGFYLTGEGQAGAYHPLHWVLYRHVPFRAAFNLELLLNYPFMLAGMYLFLRRRLERRDAALLGAAAFTFSGFCLLHLAHVNAIAVVAHLPWLLWALDVSLRTGNARRRALANAAFAVLIGSQLLLGYPQYVWFSLLAMGAYAAFLAFCDFSGGKERAHSRSIRLGGLALALILGLMIGAVQLWPTFEALQLSERRDVDQAFLTSGSLHPFNTVQLVAPYLLATRVVGQNTHELGLYAGAVPLALIIWYFLCNKPKGREARFAYAVLGFAIFAFLLALGRFGVLYQIQTYLPVVGSFRFPCRAIVLVHLSMAALAAIAFAELLAAGRRRDANTAPRRWPMIVLVLVAISTPPLAWWAWGPEHLAALPFMLAGPLLIAFAAALVVMASRGVRFAPLLLVVLLGVDLGVYGLSYTADRRSSEPITYLQSIPNPPADETKVIAYDLKKVGQPVRAEGNSVLFRGLRRVDGYVGLPPTRKLDYRTLPALRAAGVSWVRRDARNETIAGLVESKDDWLEVPGPAARLRMVSQAVQSNTPNEDLHGLIAEGTALVEVPLDLTEGPPGTAEIVSDRPGRVAISADCEVSRLLVLADSYHPGWQAKVDGRPAPILRVNGDFIGCVLQAGTHDVEFVFRPRGVRYGRLVSMAGLGLTLALLAWQCRPRRGNRTQPIA